MAFMVPTAEYFTAEECIESEGSLFRCDQCGEKKEFYNVTHSSEGGVSCVECAEPEAGWYSRLSAPGYMDATHWLGPYQTEAEALQAIMDEYEVDEDGEDLQD